MIESTKFIIHKSTRDEDKKSRVTVLSLEGIQMIHFNINEGGEWAEIFFKDRPMWTVYDQEAIKVLKEMYNVGSA